MRVVIIEDEVLTAKDLADTLVKVDPGIEVVSILHSVAEGVSYFHRSVNIDLIFSDIQLGDGLSFEIFQRVVIPTPVIFCTAYDEYALKAFKANGMDYVLKPFTTKTIAEALRKYNKLQNHFSGNSESYSSIAEQIREDSTASGAAILVYFKDKIIPVKLKDIALFYIENEVSYLVTFDQRKYSAGKSLEELERIAGNDFYRANRKLLISRKAIKDASPLAHRKLAVNLSIPFDYKMPITVSKIKVPQFLQWLSGS